MSTKALILDLPIRRSPRLSGHNDAAATTYFVTFCTASRDPILSRVIESRVSLSPLGRLVARVGFDVMRRTASASLVSAVLMPDHVHAIVALEHASAAAGFQGTRSSRPRSLPCLVSLVKGYSAAAVNRYRGTPGAPVWQRSFHDHLIRDPRDLDRHRRDIALNPHRWSLTHP